MASEEGKRAQTFLLEHEELLTMNQYWYSVKTIETMVSEVQEYGKRIAFLSTPSVYFSLTDLEIKKNSRLFDFDERFSWDSGYVKFDYKAVDKLPASYRHSFDYVVVDPPFITEGVWTKYAEAAKLLLTSDPLPETKERVREGKIESGGLVEKKDGGLEKTTPGESLSLAVSTPISSPSISPPSTSEKAVGDGKSVVLPSRVLLSTLAEHEDLMLQLLNASARRFRPKVPTLIYQYRFFTNYPSKRLEELNSEVDQVSPPNDSRKTFFHCRPEDTDQLLRKDVPLSPS